MLMLELEGKAVVDILNPLNKSFDGLVTPPGTSAAETIRDALPSGAKIVKAFNTTFAVTLVSGQVAGQRLDVFIAADDQQAKDAVASLARGGGLNPIDVGALERARQLEALGLLGITLPAAVRHPTSARRGSSSCRPDADATNGEHHGHEHE